MFRSILETVLPRRLVPTQFPLKRSSRDVSSIGDIPAVVSDVALFISGWMYLPF